MMSSRIRLLCVTQRAAALVSARIAVQPFSRAEAMLCRPQMLVPSCSNLLGPAAFGFRHDGGANSLLDARPALESPAMSSARAPAQSFWRESSVDAKDHLFWFASRGCIYTSTGFQTG